jgi:hypothetical protein
MRLTQPALIVYNIAQVYNDHPQTAANTNIVSAIKTRSPENETTSVPPLN